MGVILIALGDGALSEAQRDEVRGLAPEMRVVQTEERAQMEALLDEVEIAVGGVPRDLIMKMPHLRWFQQWAAGADWLLKYPEASERPFVLTSTSGIHAIQISEHIFAMLLAFARRLPDAIRAQATREWKSIPGETLFELDGKTMLMVGVGAIGAHAARMAAAMGMRVWGVRNDPSQLVEGVERMRGPDDLATLLPDADFVVLTVPLTEETRNMIGESELRAMKRSAILINIGRGGTVDEAALARALHEGWIAGAGLDVFEEEPLPADSPLWDADNLILTAHYSGATPHYDERATRIFLDNLRRFQAGEPLHNVVNKARGY